MTPPIRASLIREHGFFDLPLVCRTQKNAFAITEANLRDYGGLDNATFYASTGLGIYDMWTEKFCEVDGEKTTLEDALSRRQFGKIYFQIGIN